MSLRAKRGNLSSNSTRNTNTAFMKPIIGITHSNKKSNIDSLMNYVEAVRRFGGEPLPLSLDIEMVPEYIKKIDGLLLSGGPDIDPVYYNEELVPCPDYTPCPHERTEFEFAMLKAALKRGRPVLGICLGVQTMNVYFGGGLYQDMDGHRQVGGKDSRHGVTVVRDTRLSGILGAARVRVNSAHHQAIKTVGKGLVVSAVSGDGFVEAIELPGKRFVVGVQWHPERMKGNRYAGMLFRAFITACRPLGVVPVKTGTQRL